MKYLAAAIVLALLLAYLRSRRPVPATRWQESDEGVQPWDLRSVTLAGINGSAWYVLRTPPTPSRTI